MQELETRCFREHLKQRASVAFKLLREAGVTLPNRGPGIREAIDRFLSESEHYNAFHCTKVKVENNASGIGITIEVNSKESGLVTAALTLTSKTKRNDPAIARKRRALEERNRGTVATLM